MVWKTEEEKEEELALAEGVGKESLGEDMTDSKEPGEVVAEDEMEQIPEPETQIGMQLLNKDFWKEHSRLILFFVLAAFSVALCIVATDALIKRIRYQRMSQKEKGLWLYAADMSGVHYRKVDFSGAVALVIGSEGDGISRLTLEKCDYRVSLPMSDAIDSLNASVAAGVLMYAVRDFR